MKLILVLAGQECHSLFQYLEYFDNKGSNIGKVYQVQ